MKRMKIAFLAQYGIGPPTLFSAVGIGPGSEEGLYEDLKSYGGYESENYSSLAIKLIPSLKKLGVSKVTIGPGRLKYHDGSISPATNESLRTIRRMLNKSGIEARILKGAIITQ